MLGARDACEKRVPQALGEKFMAHAQVAYQPVRRVAHEASKHVAQAAAFTVQFRAQCAKETLLDVIEALLLLAEPHARMGKR
jgi:hypothetical protein